MGDDLLAFAGIAPAAVWAIARAQQFAKKLHAYTLPRQDRINTRTKGLVDLVLLVETRSFGPASLEPVEEETFARRGTHLVPRKLPPPPESWARDFIGMAAEAQLGARSLDDGFVLIQKFRETLNWENF